MAWMSLNAVAAVAHIVGILMSIADLGGCDVLYENVNKYSKGIPFTLQGWQWQAMMIADVVVLVMLGIFAGMVVLPNLQQKLADARSSAKVRWMRASSLHDQEVAQCALDEERSSKLKEDHGGCWKFFGMREGEVPSLEMQRFVADKFQLEAPLELELPPFDWAHTDAASVRGYCFEAEIDAFITGVRVPDDDAFGGAQVAQLVRFAGQPQRIGQPWTPYTTLFYDVDQSADFMEASCLIAKGDFIGVFGSRGEGTHRSMYGKSVESFDTMLGTLARLSVSCKLHAGEANQAEDRMTLGGGAPARIELRYCTAQV